MKIEAVVGAARGAVGYLVYDHAGGSGMIVDAPFGTTLKFQAAAEQLSLKILYIVSTHGHWDHIADNARLAEATGAPVCAHAWDMGRLADPRLSTERVEDRMPPVEGKRIDRYLGGDQSLEVGDLAFQVLHTPGHTPGSISLYEPKSGALFTGDLLLRQEVGRADYMGGNPSKLQESLLKIGTLPDETKVFPAHGLPTTLGQERWLLELATIATT